MNLKKFLKPTFSKLVLFLILFILAFLFMQTAMMGSTVKYGGPFNFFTFADSYGPPGEEPYFTWDTEVYSWGGLIADIIIWYLSACVIVFLFSLTKKK